MILRNTSSTTTLLDPFELHYKLQQALVKAYEYI